MGWGEKDVPIQEIQQKSLCNQMYTHIEGGTQWLPSLCCATGPIQQLIEETAYIQPFTSRNIRNSPLAGSLLSAVLPTSQ